MGPLTYALCKKPVLGLMLFVASACGFPPLFDEAPFPLQEAGARLVQEFEAPVSKPYSLMLHFHFPTAASIRADEVVGDRHDAACERDYATLSIAQRMGLGRPIPVHVLVRDKKTGAVALDQIVDTLCLGAQGGHPRFSKTRTAVRFELAAGSYVIELRNMNQQAGLDGVRTTVSLVSGDRK